MAADLGLGDIIRPSFSVPDAGGAAAHGLSGAVGRVPVAALCAEICSGTFLRGVLGGILGIGLLGVVVVLLHSRGR